MSSWFKTILCISCLLIAGAIPAVAQQNPIQEEEELSPEQRQAMEQAMEKSFEEEITVTGSLIPRPTTEAMSPVSTVDPEEITYSGVTRLEDLVRQLPQVISTQNSTVSNGASGTATVNLRQLGTVRTLVLINGRRTVPGDAFSVAPDLNFIPASLIKRIDILTGGASTVYGADAVSGVVNFIMDTTFTGVRANISYAGYQHNNSNSTAARINEESGFDYPTGSTFDGDTWDVNIALGSGFADGKGHATAYIDYRHIDAMRKDARDYTNCSVGNLGAEGPECGGSATRPTGTFWTFDSDLNTSGFWMIDQIADGGNGSDLVDWDGRVFNFAPQNFHQRPDERWTAGAFVNYEINDHFDVYTEFMFMDDFSDAQIAYTGNFAVTDIVNCDNPMMSEQQRATICTDYGWGPTDDAQFWLLRRNVEGEGRNNALQHTSWRLVAGMKGDITDYWSYDVYGMLAAVSSPQEYENDFYIPRLQEAMLVVEDDEGNWVCRSGNPDCVPWNFLVEGGVTQESLDYIYIDTLLNSGVSTEMWNASLFGDLEGWGLTIPSASEGIQVALGAEYRVESLFVHPDEAQQAGDIAGFGGETARVDGQYKVQEAFIEALIPFVQDVTGFRDLSMELGYRYSDYNTSGAFPSWKAQFAWAPTDSWKFRVGYNRATRSPNVQELFAPVTSGLGGSEDICAGENPTATLEQCLRTGATEAQYGNIAPNPAGQYNTRGGGNINLEPEVADTLTAGIVWTPQSIAGLSLTLDYYDIEISDTIDSFNFNDIVQTCADTGDPALCSLIFRGQGGTLWAKPEGYVSTQLTNIGVIRGEGVDLNFAWLIGLGNSGYLNTSLIGGYRLTNFFDNPLIDYDCVGYYGNQCFIPDPEWRHTARISWETNFNWVFTMGWRYLGEVLIDDASPDPDLNNDALLDTWKLNGSYENSAFNYLDLAVSWNIGRNVQWVLGCNNVLDEEPPLGSGVDPNDYAAGMYGFYDPYGRYVHTSFQFTF